MSTVFNTKQETVKNNNTEACGLLLDIMGYGVTLTYFTEKKPKHHVNCLGGDAGWVVNAHGKITNTKHLIFKTR